MKQGRDKKIQLLLRDARKLYHTQDLAVLWGIDNSGTLYTTIKRYVQRGFLNRIHKGFYSTIPLKDIDPLLLGLTSLHRYGYVSTESILAKHGVVFQDIAVITLVSDVSKRFELAGHAFLARSMKPEYLHNDEGIVQRGGTREASLERAVADMLYFNPHYHIDAKDSIDRERVDDIQKRVGY